jgi:hypothetical protein
VRAVRRTTVTVTLSVRGHRDAAIAPPVIRLAVCRVCVQVLLMAFMLGTLVTSACTGQLTAQASAARHPPGSASYEYGLQGVPSGTVRTRRRASLVAKES